MRRAHASTCPAVAVVDVEIHACAVAARVRHVADSATAAAVVAAAAGVGAHTATQAHRNTRTIRDIIEEEKQTECIQLCKSNPLFPIVNGETWITKVVAAV